jgi:uncharacterized tellurite resistance protein B-like protein
MPTTSNLSDLAFLYLACGHAADGQLTGDEMRTLAAKLREWAGGASLEEVGAVIKGVVEEYKGIESMADKVARAESCAAALKKAHTTEELRAILGDMMAIAEADGTVTPDEESFIARIGARFGITALG